MLFTAIEQEQPGYRDAAALLTTAQRQRDLAQWSDQAAEAAEHEDWDAAVSALEQICAADPTYRGAGARLEQARSAQRLRSLLEKVKDLHQAGRWKEVVAAADELTRLDPDNRDPGGIVADAKAKFAKPNSGTGMPRHSTTSTNNTGSRQPMRSPRSSRSTPGYRDAAALLKTAQHNLEAAGRTQAATPPASPPPLFERVNRRTKIVLAAVALVVVVCRRRGNFARISQRRASLSPSQVVLPFTGLDYPEGVAVDGAGNVYVTDSGNKRVLKLAVGASTPTELPFTGLSNPEGVAVDGTGTVYVTDYATTGC